MALLMEPIIDNMPSVSGCRSDQAVPPFLTHRIQQGNAGATEVEGTR